MRTARLLSGRTSRIRSWRWIGWSKKLGVDEAPGYTKGAKWSATGTAIAPHKDSGGNVLYNDGHVAWNNSLSATVGTNNGVAVLSAD